MRILVQPYTHTLSHISRPLLVAKELRNRGHEVLFAGESPKVMFIQKEGFDVVPCHEPDPVELFGNIRKGRLRFINEAAIQRMMEADIALYRNVQPDVILTDGRFTAPISSHIAGIKHVAIVNASSTEYRAAPYFPLFEWMPAWLLKRDTAQWTYLDLLNLKLEMLLFDNVMSTFKKLSKKYSIEKTVTATNCLTGKDITLLADIPEYFPTMGLPESYHYIGPLTWKSTTPPPSWWPPEKRGNPLIYLTMGTTGIGDFFSKAIDLFRHAEMTAIITTGAQAKDLHTIDEKVYIEEFLDGDLAMAECDLVVCHGGNGTIYQALQHGKPIIGIPTIPDQQFNMRRVEALGIGKTITWNKFSENPQSLLQLIQNVIEDGTFKINAMKLRNILDTYDGAKTAANILIG